MNQNPITSDQIKKRILVVEDEPELGALYKLLLQKAGYDVQYAADGQKALDFLNTQDFDLVLLDVMLPELDGFQIVENLQQQPDRKDVVKSIVLLTNVIQDAAINKASELGVQGYLVKSDYNPHQFLAKVKSYL